MSRIVLNDKLEKAFLLMVVKRGDCVENLIHTFMFEYLLNGSLDEMKMEAARDQFKEDMLMLKEELRQYIKTDEQTKEYFKQLRQSID